jgi:transcriptional regulator with XRE-family HTH domain
MSTPLGIKIRRARDAKGWSRRRLADETDIPYTTLQNIERPRSRKPERTSEENLQKLADALNCDLDELRILAGYRIKQSATVTEAKARVVAELSAHPRLDRPLTRILRRNNRDEIDRAADYLEWLDSRHTQ